MSKEVVKATEVQFPALTRDPQEIMAAIQANLGGENLTAWDLDRVKIPSGGGLAWDVPTLEGVKPQPEILGVIVYVQNARAYWTTSYDEGGGGQPPDCISDDAVTGRGIPGGPCLKCPYSAFGSGKNERGQACRQIRRLFMLRTDEILPMVVNLPAKSLAPSKNYLLRLASHGLNKSSIVTRIGLERDKNQEGKVYSRATFAMAGNLSREQAMAAAGWETLLKTASHRVAPEDFVNGDGDGI